MKLRSSRVQQLQKAITSSRPSCLSRFLVPSATTRTSRPTQRRTYAAVSAADLQFGQPVHETHPHLLRAGESMYLLIIWVYIAKFCQLRPALLLKNMRTVDRSLPQACQRMELQFSHPQIQNGAQVLCSMSFTRSRTSCT
jgi:hypothetical protein